MGKTTKQVITKLLAEKVGIHKDFAVEYMEALDDIIAQEVLKNPDGVYLDNIGTFRRVVKPATNKFIPSAGEERPIPERVVVKFRPSKTFTQRIQ